MTQSEQVLHQFLVKIHNNSLQNKRSLVVFDLDSTLFDVSPRTEKILREFAEHPEFLKDFQHLLQQFQLVKVQHGDWGIRDALMRVDFSHLWKSADEQKKLEKTIKDFWFQRFFSNEYLHYDQPYEGAIEFVQNLAKFENLDIVYLTGRDVVRLGKGSEEVLLKWNFPLDNQRSRLVLKPYRELDDSLFKFEWFKDLPKDQYSYVCFFENEPVNVNRVRTHLPDVDIIFFDSTHSRREDVCEPICKIDSYKMSST